ncbi:5-(carboxyamino)imidazole ribonucleotide synthase [Burkholderiales bacterium]|nr:5-(carboxyamino)imidazole ribonucleotide synthase [Burkholderiales bacterium]
MIRPGSWLGILGGGQLGRMFTQAAQSMGYRVVVLDPDPSSPGGRISDSHLMTEYDDLDGLKELARVSSAVTTEFENIPADSLRFLSDLLSVSPQAEAVEVAQDRIREKAFLDKHGFRVVPYTIFNDANDLANLSQRLVYPGLLKVSRFGYDGKGQLLIEDLTELKAGFEKLGGVPCVFEQFLPLEAEVSVIVARDEMGVATVFPVAENQHRNGILDVTIAPARVDNTIVSEAKQIALSLGEVLQYKGVLCVEFFVLSDGVLVINEIAPRPHNSGHFSMDACSVSQFEQQVRVTGGLPLIKPIQHTPAVMINLLGDLWENGEPPWGQILNDDRVRVHLYGKDEARSGRKMGHLTIIDKNLDEALILSQRIKTILGKK